MLSVYSQDRATETLTKIDISPGIVNEINIFCAPSCACSGYVAELRFLSLRLCVCGKQHSYSELWKCNYV
jgi:hypothetical protein